MCRSSRYHALGTALIAQIALCLSTSASADSRITAHEIDQNDIDAVIQASLRNQDPLVPPSDSDPIPATDGVGFPNAPASGPSSWQDRVAPLSAPTAAPAPGPTGDNRDVMSLMSHFSHNDTFSWAAPGEEWSIARINQEVADMRANGPYNLVFYGDSILQCLRFEMPVCQGTARLTEERFGKYRPYVLAVGNEKVTSLMYRFLHGAAPVDINGDNLTAVVLMVGNNDIGRASLQNRTSQLEFGNAVAGWLTEMIYWLLDQDPGIQVVPISLLPATGSSFSYVDGSLYIPGKQVNQQLKYLAEVEPRVHYVDCIDPFLLPNDKTKSNQALIPDGVHPNAAGFEILADCLEPVLDSILDPIIEEIDVAADVGNTTDASGSSAPQQERPPQQQQQRSHTFSFGALAGR